MAFSTYEKYVKNHRGVLSEEQYGAVVEQAYAEIISQTAGRALQAPEMEMRLCMCECALADALHEFAQVPSGVASVSNDGYGMHFERRSDEQKSVLCGICTRWLQWPINLMSRWL